MGCTSATDAAGNKQCQVENTCFSPCTTCGQCIKNVYDAIQPLTSNANITVTASDVASALATYCAAAGYSDVACTGLNKLVMTSPGGQLGLRPARVCQALGACYGACKVLPPSSAAATVKVDTNLCSADGTVSSAAVGATSFTIPNGKCRSDTDCTASDASFCDYSNSSAVSSSCMCVDGNDGCITLGVCISQCELPGIKAFLAEVDAAITTCTTNDNCAAGEECTAATDCVDYTCTPSAGLTTVACSGEWAKA